MSGSLPGLIASALVILISLPWFFSGLKRLAGEKRSAWRVAFWGGWACLLGFALESSNVDMLAHGLVLMGAISSFAAIVISFDS